MRANGQRPQHDVRDDVEARRARWHGREAEQIFAAIDTMPVAITSAK